MGLDFLTCGKCKENYCEGSEWPFCSLCGEDFVFDDDRVCVDCFENSKFDRFRMETPNGIIIVCERCCVRFNVNNEYFFNAMNEICEREKLTVTQFSACMEVHTKRFYDKDSKIKRLNEQMDDLIKDLETKQKLIKEIVLKIASL